MFKNRGFTLIELLVTISIIAILSVIGFVVYASVIRQGRDSKRQSDLLTIQSALEQYNSDQGFYPYSAHTLGNNNLDSLLAATPPPAFTNAVGSSLTSSRTYITTLPVDPLGTFPYRYDAIPNTSGSPCDNSAKKCTSYCLYAHFENPPNPVPSPPGTCAYPTSDYNYFVTVP